MKNLKMVLSVAVSLMVGTVAYAQNYPTKPVRMIVPFAPGGASDVVGRILQPGLVKDLGQQVVVDNRGGASGNIGVEVAARSPADGYTFLLGNIGTMAINPGLFPKFPIHPVRDFIAVTQVVDVPTCLAVHPSLPVKTVNEFIEYAKARPGELNFSSGGPGSNGRLEMELFMRQAGISLVHVSYKGGAGPAAIGLIGGEVQCAFLSLPPVLPHVTSGKLRVIGVAQPKRVASLPEVPVFPELGFPSMRSGSWQGVYVPVGTPRPIVDRLFAAFTKGVSDLEVIKRLNDNGAEVVTSKSPEDFAAFMKRENEKWGKVIKEVGVVME
jgi:tripartite-type tricarboxylate transporter receptor subunit TctC